MPVHSFEKEPPKLAYVDPSFFVNLLVEDSKYFKECKKFSKKIQEKETILIASNLGLDEIWYALLKLLAVKNYESEWLNRLRENPELVMEYSHQIEEYTFNLLSLPMLFFLEISVQQTSNALEIMKKEGLFPRDAIHLSVVKSGIGNIITTDSDFARVKEINVYTCNPKAFE